MVSILPPPRQGSYFWWVVVPILGGALYLFAMHHKKVVWQELSLQLRDVEVETARELARQGELLTQLRSQEDPAWVEMVLRRNLGVVAEGEVKVYFQQDP